MHEKKGLTKNELAQIVRAFSIFAPVTPEIQDYFCKNAATRHVKKGKLVTKTGDINEYIYFVKKGTLRGYIEDGEKEITTWISIENEMVTSINSFIFQVPTYENIQALEDCELFGTSFTDLENLYLLYPYYNLVGRKVAEIYYTMAENRAALVRYRSAEKKFEFFLQYYGHLSGRVSLKYIASFLGITLETLSRVRTKYYASK